MCDHNRLYLAESDHRRVAQAAGGNPLFVRELTLHSARTASEGPLPRSLRAVMHERLSRLNPEQTHILRLIALLGAHSHVSTLLSITGLNSARLTASLEDLEFEGVVRLSHTRALSLHDCWQTTVLEGTTPIVRAALALDCAQALDATPESIRSESYDWRTAELFSQAGDSERSLPLFARVADSMYARGLSNDAATILELALRSGGTDRPLLALRARYARALFGSGRLQEVLSACDAGLAFRVPKEEDQRNAHACLACLRLDALAKLRMNHRTALAVVASIAIDEEIPPDARQLACLTGIVVAFNDTTSGYEDVFHEASASTSRSHRKSVIGCLVQLIYGAEHGDRRRVEEIEVGLQELEGEPIAEHLRCRALRTRAMAQRFAGNAARAFELGELAFEAGVLSGLMGESALAAEQMTFAALDFEDDSLLALWLKRWDACSSPHAYFERSRARVHAACRISISQDRFAEGLSHYGMGDDDTVDPLGKRRAVDDAALCRCLAALGRREESLVLGASSLSVYASCRASAQIDYVVDSVLGAFAALGEHERFDQLAREYVSRRTAQYSFPIAPAFRELQRCSDGRFDGRQTGREVFDDETRIRIHGVLQDRNCDLATDLHPDRIL